MNAALQSAIVAGLMSGAVSILCVIVLQRIRNVTTLEVADINADTQDEISKRNALAEEQKRLNEERARLDKVRSDLEQGRTVEMGGLKLQLKTMQEAMIDERKQHAKEMQDLKSRVWDLERELVKAQMTIIELQRGQHT